MTSVVQGQAIMLTALWWEYPGGPPALVDDVQIEIAPAAGGAAVVGPTASGVARPDVGINTYTWATSSATPTGDYLATWTGTDDSDEAVTAVEVLSVTAAPGTAYAALEELRGMQNPREQYQPDDTARDELLQRALVTASRQIDRKTGRRFYLDDVATSRIYGTIGRTTADGTLLVDDIGSEDDLVIETGSAGSWDAVSGVVYGPDSALVDGRPITQIAPGYGYWAGLQVRVTARWGWPAVPDEISHATLLLANRLYLRASSPEGIAASGEWGAIRLSRWDPDVEALVRPYALPRMP